MVKIHIILRHYFFTIKHMKFAKILGVLGAVYAAGVALTMKKRKDDGNSKLPEDASKSTLGNIRDEIVDIHKTAYADVKHFITTTFDGVNDLDSLKKKVSLMADEFSLQAEKVVADLKKGGEAKRAELQKFLEDGYAKAQDFLKMADAKAREFGANSEEKVAVFLDDAKAKIEKSYTELKSKLEK